jgi:hypothetical protein
MPEVTIFSSPAHELTGFNNLLITCEFPLQSTVVTFHQALQPINIRAAQTFEISLHIK